MRKCIAAICLLLICITSACSNSAKAEKVPKTESEIRTMVYQSLSKNEKESIFDWENAKVEEYTADWDHRISTAKESLDLKGIETYRVTFHIDGEAAFGPLTVYIDKNSYKLLGHDLGE